MGFPGACTAALNLEGARLAFAACELRQRMPDHALSCPFLQARNERLAVAWPIRSPVCRAPVPFPAGWNKRTHAQSDAPDKTTSKGHPGSPIPAPRTLLQGRPWNSDAPLELSGTSHKDGYGRS